MKMKRIQAGWYKSCRVEIISNRHYEGMPNWTAGERWILKIDGVASDSYSTLERPKRLLGGS